MSECRAKHSPVTGDKIPAAVGPYSPAVSWGDVVFCSGQLGADPDSGQLAEGVEAQTRQALSNLSNLLEAAGSCIGCVVKTTVFLNDMNDFPAMNAIYAEALGENRPARSTVEVARLPLDALVEVETIAYKP